MSPTKGVGDPLPEPEIVPGTSRPIPAPQPSQPNPDPPEPEVEPSPVD